MSRFDRSLISSVPGDENEPAGLVPELGQAGRKDGASRRSVDQLLLESLVPQLLKSLRREPDEATAPAGAAFSRDTVLDFTLAVLEVDESVSVRFIDDLREAGASTEALYLDLFSESARLLGEFWDLDRCPYMEVTLALWRLHRLVRELSASFKSETGVATRRYQALLTTALGEQHSFGLVLVSEFFRRAGWNVMPGPLESNAEIAQAVSAGFPAVVGFSISSEAHLDRLAASIAIVRRKSRNRAVGVMVGGAMFADRPDLVARVGADTSATDAADALARAQSYAARGVWGRNDD